MRDLRKELRQYIDLRRGLGYKLRKHEPRLTEFLAFSRSEAYRPDHHQIGHRVGNGVVKRP
jgi:hypothetical protein